MTDASVAPHRPQPAADSRRLAQRVGLLFACIAAGLGIGFAGQALSGDSAWFLAVPVCMLIGWLGVADPTQCSRPRGRPEGPDGLGGPGPEA